ncbi:MAG: TetR/AcrR family transcriptional regulator [Steroidobacteraceae bacterium]|jgi:AcrR family transcriptional regulator
MSQKQRRTQTGRRAVSEQRIIDAAMHVIGRKGTDRLTLSEVGTEAGYSRGLPAHLFGNKEGLLLRVLDRYLSYVPGRTHFALPDWEPGRGLERLRVIIQGWIGTGVRHPEYFRTYLILSGEAAREGPTGMGVALRAQICAMNHRTRTELARYLRQGRKHGEIAASVDPQHAALLIMSTLSGLLAFWVLDPQAFSLRRAASRCLDDLLARLRRSA